MKRRDFLYGSSLSLALAYAKSTQLLAQPAALPRNPFQLGVASGDPEPDGVVLWTRLAMDPLAVGAGMSTQPVDVRWEIATDDKMKQIVKKGRVAALPELGHSVHVEVEGLRPYRHYFYRFHAGGFTSEIGRAKTAPLPDADLDKLRFAFISCQMYEQGYFVAHRDIAQQDLDLVLFLGDYIYERKGKAPELVRHHLVDDIKTVEEYRQQYALYKTDSDLKACHAAHTWIVTPDDHEVENDWAGDRSRRPNEPDFVRRRTAAYQAFYENMPLRIEAKPKQEHIQIYRKLPYGKLAQFTVLDTRQFRSFQPCGDGGRVSCADRFNPASTMMGPEQETWFAQTLSGSPARWNLVANQVTITQRNWPLPDGTPAFTMDAWDGYVAARNRLFDYLKSRRPRNAVFLTGDAHQTWVSDLKENFDQRDSPTIASELVGTSISSGGDGQPRNADYDNIMGANPHMTYNSALRGYFLCQVDSKQLTADLRETHNVTNPESTLKLNARFKIECDRKGIRQDG